MTDKVSSPVATGGQGTFFEQHVNAYWLALLLVRAIPPILLDCAMVEVHFQTEHLGWNTDDFLIEGENGYGSRRKLAGQVKLSFTVSAADDQCKKAIQDFWKDFNNGERFSPASDRLVLVTLRGTNTLLEHFAALLDCSRAARDGAEFEHRLATPGFINAAARRYCDEIRTIIGEHEGRSFSAAEVWPFLRVLHVLSLDLDTATRQTEAIIKTLLAYTTQEHDAIGAAEASWNALLVEVGEGMPQARSYGRNDLPEALRRRHSPVGGHEQRALRALNDHSALILGGIRSTIGNDLHLGRTRLVEQVIEQLESSQVVLVSGAAGSGKSGTAKDAIGILAADHFAFTFRAEEFAHPHFDETLHRSQIPASAKMLGAILAGQGRKVLLVESVERLLEASTRDAFTDLLTLVANDMSWRLVLTCRDYSADLVRTCFLESAKIGHSVVTMPPLDDAELDEVGTAYPALTRPLASATLRQLLRNPFVLDKALQIRWSQDRSLPQSEREFRTLFWKEIVRVEHHAAGGMPRRREDAFVQIALRRARALALYAPCGDLEAEVVDGLRHDSLIVSSEQTAVLVAPAHDVLEDWAILQWIDEQYAVLGGSVHDLSTALGTHPAVRRTYRKWVSELVERDPGSADGLFRAVVLETGLSAQFRDDTIVALLRSPASATFLERHRSELFANDNQLLRRVIYLLRVACVTAPAWLETTAAQVSLFNVPDGPAWGWVLRLIQAQLGSFTGGDCALFLRFIEDWARGVSRQCPYPDGAESVAAIAHWLLPHFDDYRSNDQRKRTLQVIAKIPNADRERFANLLQGLGDNEERDQTVENFREIILEGVAGMPAGRDMPEIVVVAAKDYLLCSEDDLRDEWGFTSPLHRETLFGIKEERNHGFFPASAYRGPYLALLRHHAREGLDFIISVFNHSADWYAHPRVGSEHVDQPLEMTLTFADGTSRKQWCDAQLWGLYRGMTGGLYVLQCLLMALERWLLEVAESSPDRLDGILQHILKRSDSGALTAVVASVATAFPHAAGETLLVLLRSRHCIELDRGRFALDSRAPSRMARWMPRLNAQNDVYDEERNAADALTHRGRDLENAIANLQLGPFAPRVYEILERHRAEMPPVEEQNVNDRAWRLAMHRMDLRQYSVAENAPEDPVSAEEQEALEEGRQYVRLEPNAPDPDIKEMVDQSAGSFQAMNAGLGLLMWGVKVYGHEDRAKYDPGQWRQRLQEARSACVGNSSGDELHELDRGGPGFVAAICVREYWEELSDDERDWCLNLVCSEVEREGDHWNQFARVQMGTMSADRACASVLPIVVGKSRSDEERFRVYQTLVVALTHAIDEVRSHAAWGIGSHLWAIDREIVLRCANGLATEAMLVQQSADAEAGRPYTDRRQLDDIAAEAACLVRQRFFEADGIANDAYQLLDTTQGFGAEANGRILAILGQAPTEPASIAAFQRLAHMLVAWWDADDNRQRNRRERRRERNYETESVLKDILESFLLRTSADAAAVILGPILDAVDRHPREIYPILLGLTGVEDRQPNTAQFWSLWMLFAERVQRAGWLATIDREHADGKDLMSAVFLGLGWKDDVRHWRSLEGHAHLVHALFEDLPSSSAALSHYVRFLYHIGEQSLPEAFVRIAKRLQQGDAGRMLMDGNTVFMLEILLQRYVYGRPLELKRQRDLRDATLALLDMLVEQGSSAAFRMRDDFVTPMSLQS